MSLLQLVKYLKRHERTPRLPGAGAVNDPGDLWGSLIPIESTTLEAVIDPFLVVLTQFINIIMHPGNPVSNINNPTWVKVGNVSDASAGLLFTP